MARRLGEILLERGAVDADKLSRALRLQNESEEPIGVILVQVGDVAERDVAAALALQLDLPLVEADEYAQTPDLDGQISTDFLQQSKCVPLRIEGNTLVVAMSDPNDQFTVSALELATGRLVTPSVGTQSDISRALQRFYGSKTSIDDIIETTADTDATDNATDIQQLRDRASEAPIIRVVNHIIARALEAGASDIHLEPFEHEVKVRYRVDGVLREIEAPPAHSAAAIVSRVKVMSKLNIAERRLPQDGRIKLKIEGREIDMRISTVPTLFGESIVMRILDKTRVPLNFEALGFTPEILPRLYELVARPHGIILATGPTGSGKTTTLYAALEHLNEPEKKILTVEDPVEYQLTGINQIQVKPQIGLSFAAALRAILRQDPDVIMVGEMRDLETATIAVQSALTGHKVFTTLHTNDAASSITRLVDMGIEPFLLTSTLNGILAQRLVRTLCKACKKLYTPNDDLKAELQQLSQSTAKIQLYRALGCSQCEDTGYSGRTCIVELISMNEAVRDVVLNHGDALAIQRVAIKQGMTTMYRDGLRKTLAGITTVEEVVRVTQEE